MTKDEIIERCGELAEECEKLARQAERAFSLPIGQAVYNAEANLCDAAEMARRMRGGTRGHGQKIR